MKQRRENDAVGTKPKKEATPVDIERLKKTIPLMTNALRRRRAAQQLRHAVQKDRAKKRRARKAAEARGEKVTRQVPRTIEMMKPLDDTVVTSDDKEIAEADEADEFAPYFSGERQPKIMMTTSKHPSPRLQNFIKELLLVIPNCFYYKRGDYRLQSIVKYATNKDFTDVMVLNERLREPCGLYICHLPEGPTSFFKLTNLKLATEMKGGGALTLHHPEVILNNFTTRLGRRVARQLAALFPQKPEFQGRRLICFHNQRDFIFWRHHRYIFSANGSQCRLQEIGPRFTLKLRWLQQGTFDTAGGLFEYEWKPASQVDRKRMFM